MSRASHSLAKPPLSRPRAQPLRSLVRSKGLHGTAEEEHTSPDLKIGEKSKMSTTAQVPVLDMNKLNTFIGQFVMDLGAAVHTGMVVIGEKLGLYKALADGPMNSAQLAARTHTDERYLREWLPSQ